MTSKKVGSSASFWRAACSSNVSSEADIPLEVGCFHSGAFCAWLRSEQREVQQCRVTLGRQKAIARQRPSPPGEERKTGAAPHLASK